MAESGILSPCHSAGSGSPPPNCTICLGGFTDKCFSNSCMHQFCFKCLMEWSKIKAECPLCKQPFKSIIHNIKSNDEYDEYRVQTITVVEDNRYFNDALNYLPNATPPIAHQYQFRTTFTVDTHGETAVQQMLLNHPLLGILGFNAERFSHRRRRNENTSTMFRRAIYLRKLWVYAPPDVTGRYRDVSPTFFRNNPAARARLVPWLNRELNALLYENTREVMHLVDIIMDHLLRHHICSPVFRILLSNYLNHETDHFLHEFFNFMRSPFDMVGYDQHVMYRQREMVPTSYIDMSGYDSDVILVSSSSANDNNNQQQNIDIINLDTDSDEPIFVSENTNVNLNNANETVSNEDDNRKYRKPVLPIKIRLKNNNPVRKKRPFSSTSSSSTSSSSSSISSSSNEKRKRRKRRRKRKLNKSWQIEKINNTSEDEDENIPLSNLRETSRKCLKKKHKMCKTGKYSKYCSSSDEEWYKKSKNYVKSEIREVSCDGQKAGPSNGKLRNFFKKDESSNLWYSRPCVYDTDNSSD